MTSKLLGSVKERFIHKHLLSCEHLSIDAAASDEGFRGPFGFVTQIRGRMFVSVYIRHIALQGWVAKCVFFKQMRVSQTPWECLSWKSSRGSPVHFTLCVHAVCVHLSVCVLALFALFLFKHKPGRTSELWIWNIWHACKTKFKIHFFCKWSPLFIFWDYLIRIYQGAILILFF